MRLPILLLALSTSLLAAAETVEAADLRGRSSQVAALTLPDGSWTVGPTSDPATTRRAERDAVVAAGKTFLAAVKTAKNGPDAASRIALEQFLTTLAASGAGSRPDALDPAYARRAVRGGALRGIGADAAAPAVEQAVTAACAFTAIARWTGPNGAVLEQRANAFGESGWVLTEAGTGGKPGPIRYARVHPDPQFLPAPDLDLVVELPAGADPMQDGAKATAARLVHQGTVVAEWTPAAGLSAPAWRSVVREPRGDDMAPGLLPPHLVLCDIDGDVAQLVVEGGALVPLKNGTPAEAERFVAEAAKVLTDTPRLDLIGQHLFRYAHDSPDPRFPSLIGGDGATGDIHQTVTQTLSTAAGGQCRGDCDDLGELYQTIAEKQGRLGHLLILPSHTAFATARQHDGQWTVELMQTGPTYAISAPELPEALSRTWKKFDQTAPFSPDHLGVLLRFSGENQRGPFGLGWRIFSDPAYAKIMIDVQRDWQYQTYARAIAKMRKLVADGDTDTANYNELAALYRVTGQWDLAVEWQRKTLAQATAPESLLEMRRDLITALRRAGRTDEVKAELAKSAEDLQAAAPKLGPGLPQAAMSLAMTKLATGDSEGARTLMVERVMTPMTQLLTQLCAGVERGRLTAERWQSDGNLVAVRRILGTFINCQTALLIRAGNDAAREPSLQTMRRNVELWAARLAFLDAATPAETLGTYAGIARLHSLDIGREALDREVSAATPADGKRDHLARPADLAAARAEDVRWIALSPGYWAMRQGRALLGKQADTAEDEESAEANAPDPAQADRAQVVAFGKKAVEMRDRCVKLGMVSDRNDAVAHQAALIAAVIGGDDKLLRERLRYVASRKDKRLYESCSRTLGQLAPYCDTARWAAVLKAWADEVNYQPKWFAIAWAAAVNGARDQAIATAKMAAQRFPTEKAFAEEAAFMADVLKQPAKRN